MIFYYSYFVVVFIVSLCPNLLNLRRIAITVRKDKTVSITDERYLSFAMDSGLIKHNWKGLDFKYV